MNEKYKAKVEAMQIYVPLLTKLIAKLEAKNDESEESVEKISHLKALLEQLSDPKPGISFAELNECHQVMENLFKSNKADATKLTQQKAQINETTDKEIVEMIKNQQIVPEKSQFKEKVVQQTENSEKFTHEKQNPTDTEQIKDSNDESSIESEKVAETNHKQNSNIATEKENIYLETQVALVEAQININSNINENEEKQKPKIYAKNITEESEKFEEEETAEKHAEDLESDNEEYENVELIEFSEAELDDSFENEEMILPDNEEDLLFVDPKEKSTAAEKVSNPEQKNEKEKVDFEKETEENEVAAENDKDDNMASEGENEKDLEKIENEQVTSEKNEMQSLENLVENPTTEETCKSNETEVEMAQNTKEKTNVNKVDALFDDIQPYDMPDFSKSTQSTKPDLMEDDIETLMDVDKLDDSKTVSTKRPSSQTCEEISKPKKVKTWDPLKDIEFESALETVSALAGDFLDPLAVDDLNLEQLVRDTEQPMEDTKEHEVEIVNENQNENENNKNTTGESKQQEEKPDNTKNDDVADDDDDDVEIIETRNSPILIESDDDDDDNNVEKSSDANKADGKQSADAPKPTTTTTQQQQSQNQLVISNVKSLKQQQNKNSLTTINLLASKTVVTFRKNVNGKNEQQRMVINKNNSTAPTSAGSSEMISGPNPQLFSTRLGNRNLLIPNAFYGTSKEKNSNPDIAHCRWLENFLRHFCSPYNIAHNTCFLLLQRALRAEDYATVRQMRLDLNVTKGEIDEELLRILRCIFYVDGIAADQKLTFVGRKFCNLAFVNILDKTVSLTVDWRTNGVTSRTRISAATLEAARQQKTTTTTIVPTEAEYESLIDTSTVSKTTVTQKENATKKPAAAAAAIVADTPPQTANQMPIVRSFIPVEKKSTTPVQRVETTIPANLIRNKNRKTPTPKIITTTTKRLNKQPVDVEFITGDDVNLESYTETTAVMTPRRSQRNASRLAQKEISSNRFIYSDDDNDNDIDYKDEGDDLEFLPEKDDSSKSSCGSGSVSRSSTNYNPDLSQVDISAAIKDFPVRKAASAEKPAGAEKTAPGKKATTFEMAFLERLAHHDKDAFKRAKKQKATTATTTTAVTPATNQNQEIVILDDDEDDQEIITPVAPGKLPLEPRLVAQKRIKNIDSGIHLKGKYVGYCLVCKRKVNHIVGHYVNVHPDCEVYNSRPTPAYAVLLMKKQMEIAKYDRERNGFSLFVATCVFCEKRGSFTFSYWYQHFASHTGEYAYQCTGCGIRKPSRAHLISHLSACQKKGEIETTQNYDCSLTKITAYMCLICNYTQMNCANIMKHIICEHGYARVQRDHWTDVTLLEIPKSCYANLANTIAEYTKAEKAKSTKRNELKKTKDAAHPIVIRDSHGDIFEIAELNEGKSFAVDLTANIDPPPFVVNEADNGIYNANSYNNSMDEIGDVEGIIQAYVNRKK